jgi:hypothetical protein
MMCDSREPTPGRYSQGVYERLDYDNDWSDWVPAGDAIITSTWTAIPYKPTEVGLTVTDGGYTSTSTTIWVSGGDEGVRYAVMNIVTTQGGRTGERILEFRIKGHPHHRFGNLTGVGARSADAAA